MVFSLLCLTKLSSSVTIIWAVVGLPVGDIYICACICSCFPLRKCSKTKKRRTREIACFKNLAHFAAYKLVDSNFVFRQPNDTYILVQCVRMCNSNTPINKKELSNLFLSKVNNLETCRSYVCFAGRKISQHISIQLV